MAELSRRYSTHLTRYVDGSTHTETGALSSRIYAASGIIMSGSISLSTEAQTTMVKAGIR